MELICYHFKFFFFAINTWTVGFCNFNINNNKKKKVSQQFQIFYCVNTRFVSCKQLFVCDIFCLIITVN